MKQKNVFYLKCMVDFGKDHVTSSKYITYINI